MKKTYLLIAFTLLNTIIKAQNPNWAQDIAPILYKNCTNCHHTGGLAPFPLISFSDAVAVQIGMQDAVINKRMPPWPPDPSFVQHTHERILTPAEITAIDDWINNGAPSGNLSLAPTPPVYNNLTQLGIPDLSMSIPTYSVGGTSDIYRCFPIPSGLTSKQFITSLEVIPGNSSIVHHVLVYADNLNTCYTLDSADPGPGYTNFGGPGVSSAKLIGAWVPGADPYLLPQGMGIPLDSATNIIVQIHYPAGSLGMIDSTRLNFILSPPPMRDVTILPILNHLNTLVNGPLYINANATKTFHEKYVLPAALDISLLSVAPHMHLIGKNFKSYAVSPAGDTIPFIRINNWDFRWQGNYSFKNVLKVPGGSTLHAFALYDNTINNLFNPNSPPLPVSAGESTTDEMMLEYFFFLPYQAGDEFISQDSLSLAGISTPEMDGFIVTAQLFDVSPNPVSDQATICFYLPKSLKTKLTLHDMQGRLLRTLQPNTIRTTGYQYYTFTTTGLPSGAYLITLQAGETRRTKRFIKE